ncbi:MAG: hypothetical protein Q8P82_02765 [bacterium]|nr:hypothetical protein [bacterium]
MHEDNVKKKVAELYQNGKSYSEIRNLLNDEVAKSTISDWCRNVKLTPGIQKQKEISREIHLAHAR